MLTHLGERAQLRNQRYPTDGEQRVDLVFSREAAVPNTGEENIRPKNRITLWITF
jgi:hypothetical protein